MLNLVQVNLSMLFPEPSALEGRPTNPMPAFLSGEKRQAIRTSTFIPPKKTVERASGTCYPTQLRNYLYVASYLYNTNDLTPPRSKYSIGLGEDLDDAAVSLLIKQGLGSRFPTPCDAWKSRNAESEKTAQKSIFEEKRRVDEQLKSDQPLLEDTLARGVISRILDKYPYVLLSKFHMSSDSNAYVASLTRRGFSARPKPQTLGMLLQVQYCHSCLFESKVWYQTLPTLRILLRFSRNLRENLTTPSSMPSAGWQGLASTIRRNE